MPENYSKFDLSFKLIVIGDSSVGKSSLTTMATKNIFEESYSATIGFEFFTFNIKLNGKVIKLQIWDTCGQELYRSLITNFYRNSSLAIIVYNVTDRKSFENVDLWFKELRTHSNPNVKVFLIGNKNDLEDQRKVQTEEGEKYAEQYKINKFLETSAKSGFNAKKMFIEAAKILYDDYILYHKDSESDNNSENSGRQSNNNDKSIEVNSTRSSMLGKDQDTVQHEQVNEVETEDETVKNEPEARLQEEANLKPDNPTQGAASNQNITGDIASDQTSVTNAGTQIQSTVSPKEAENIRITGISKKIAAGKKIQLTVKAGFDDTIVDDITWYSSNTNYATVDEDGIVCVKKAGKNKKVIIYATAEDGNKLASYTINIMPNAVKKITITASSKTVKAGNQLKLKASVTPKLSSKKINDTLKWSSNNTKYATVSQKGVVKAKKAGKGKKVKITAKATDGSNKKKTITISIRK